MPLKTCTCCEVAKPLSEYHFIGPRRPGQVRPECKTCAAKRTHLYYLREKERINARTVATMRKRQLARFGVTVVPEVCAICGAHESEARNGRFSNGGRRSARRLALDHCHVTGRFRGFLCHMCNAALGCASDDPDLLRAMARYLEAAMQRATG